MCAAKDKPDAVNVCCDCKKAKCDLGSEQWVGIDRGEHYCPGNENHNERRYFDNEVYAFVERDKNEFLGAPLAEKSSLKERFGDDAPEPDTNEGKMKGE
ncbi:MAG: hypothetical protein H6R15_490 [Proteobacteria bacterium]|nr:hypothetical protein [Pseudomonadota bacterium]